MTTDVNPEALGARLARSVRSRFESPGDGVRNFAQAMTLDFERVQSELAYLSIVTMHFCISTAFDADILGRVLAAFYGELWRGVAWIATAEEFDARAEPYQSALKHPHPKLGRGYSVGRAFATLCGASHDLPVIEFGARAYVEQLPPILGLLRSVTVA